MFRTFDFASPDTSNPQRYETTVPQQALFLMNNPFVLEQARGVLKRPELADVADVQTRVSKLYRLIYGRGPTRRGNRLAEAIPGHGGRDSAQADRRH